ncbi:MAG: hypothetical protein M3Q38_07790 [Chloroflexota bacterium]|nr:hypothetical protein [Chloroflexota bacterium]
MAASGAPSVARRCATALSSRHACEIDGQWGSPTDWSVRMVRGAVIDELALSVDDLLAALAENWRELASLEMPINEGSSLLAFANEVLLQPLLGACLQLWLVERAPLAVGCERTDPGERDEWSEWSILSGDDWRDLVDAELIRLGHPRRAELKDGDEFAWQLADARAAHHAAQGRTAAVAASIVRTSGWPGDRALITSLAERAVDLAMPRIGDVDPDTDNDEIIEEIKAELTPSDEVLLQWLGDPSFGTLSDGCSATGEEALRDAADWLIWRVCNDAVEFVCAIGRPRTATA